MATRDPVVNKDVNAGIVWSGIVTGDTVTEANIPKRGRYALTISGTFAGGTVAKLLMGPVTGPTKSIQFFDTATATPIEVSFTAAMGPIIIGPIPEGMFVKPSVASGAADSVTFTLAYAGE
jgi:hypothetical protein